MVELLKNGDIVVIINSISIFVNNMEFSSVVLEVNYYLSSNWGILVGIVGVFCGEIIVVVFFYFFGIFYDFC